MGFFHLGRWPFTFWWPLKSLFVYYSFCNVFWLQDIFQTFLKSNWDFCYHPEHRLYIKNSPTGIYLRLGWPDYISIDTCCINKWNLDLRFEIKIILLYVLLVIHHKRCVFQLSWWISKRIQWCECQTNKINRKAFDCTRWKWLINSTESVILLEKDYLIRC